MVDTLTKAQRSERMSRVRGKNTKPEMTVRRLVHSMGYRYRLHRAGLPGKPDLVFPSRRKVIFVHGCFWHRHPDPDCKLTRLPKSRLDFWEDKLEKNHQRDVEIQNKLLDKGWDILVLWECRLNDSNALHYTVRNFLQ